MNSQPETRALSSFQRMTRGQYGLAVTYWTLFLVGMLAFFVTGSIAVAQGEWQRYLMLLASSLAWTFILLIGVRVGYRGADPGKALGRVAVLFLLLNITNALATLSFI